MSEIFCEDIKFIPPEKIFHLFKDKKFFCWLDSTSLSYGRYSIIGFEPFLIFKSKKRQIKIEKNNSKKDYNASPFDYLKEIFEKYKINSSKFFIPGAIGYFGYDAGWEIENLPDTNPDPLKIPDIFLCFYDFLLVFDLLRKKLSVIGIDIKGGNNSFKKKLLKFKEEIKKNRKKETEKTKCEIKSFSSNMKFSEYIERVKKVKYYIKEGDIYQINFSQRFQATGTFSSSDIYMKLRKINPAGYSAYFNFGNFEILSNSPELFIRKYRDKIMTKPMKGTSPRGKNWKEDEENKINLLNSEKDKAELIMIVDLERNDIGKICKYGSVRVKKLREIEKYKTVFQTTSTVEGILEKGIGPVEIIKATFPGGSITGAPKKRAMEIIEELEPDKRSFYTGCLGYIGFNQNILLNILIRTILLKSNNLYYPAGGGIVWDSIPEKEYEETMVKTKNLFSTLEIENVRDLLT